MATPLYRRGGVEKDLPEVISFYEDVIKQMKTAYNDLYKTFINVGERLNVTEQTLESVNKEKEKLLKQNECLSNEIEKEPLNLNSTHILHNILCNKAEAYKVLRENENRQVEKEDDFRDHSAHNNNDEEDNNKDSDEIKDVKKTEKTFEQEIKLKHDYLQIEDLLSTWKHKFENPIINLTLNVTPVPKIKTKCKFLNGKKKFKSWQDELKYCVNKKSAGDVDGKLSDPKKLVKMKEQTEMSCSEGPLKQKEPYNINEQFETHTYSKLSNEMEINNDSKLKNVKHVEIDEAMKSHEAISKSYVPCTKNINSTKKKTCSIEKYDELQFSDNSENSLESSVYKLSKENKMLNIILNQKKKVYAQVFENHARGSNYEVFKNLQSMENIEYMQNMRLGDMLTDTEENACQQIFEKKSTEGKSFPWNNPCNSLTAATTAGSHISNGNNIAIHGTKNNDEEKNKKGFALYSEHVKHFIQNKRKNIFDVANKQEKRNCFLQNDPDKEKISMVHNVEMNKNINANVTTNFSGFRINYEEQNKPEKNVLPHNSFSCAPSNNNSNMFSNFGGSYNNDALFFSNYNSVQNKMNEPNKRDLNLINKNYPIPNDSFPCQYNNRCPQNCNFRDFSNAPNSNLWNPLNYYTDTNQQSKHFGPSNYSNSSNGNNIMHCNNFNNKTIYPNIDNPVQWCGSNNFVHNIQNWNKNISHEFANDGDTILHGSASSTESQKSHLHGSSETLKNSLAYNCNCLNGRFPPLNNQCDNSAHYQNVFFNNANNVYDANKMLHCRSFYLPRDISTQPEVKNEEKRNHGEGDIDTLKILKKKKSSHFKKTKTCQNRTTSRRRSKSEKPNSSNHYYSNTDHNNHNYSNTYINKRNAGTDSDGCSEGYNYEKSNDSGSEYDSDSIFSSFCKKIYAQNIESNNLSSNYIDMNFDKRLLPYYEENDSTVPFYSSKNDVSEYINEHGHVINGNNERKRKRKEGNGSYIKKRNDLRSDISSNRSCSSDGFVSLNSCNGTNEISSVDETYHSNYISNVDNEMQIEMKNTTNDNSYNFMGLRNANCNGIYKRTIKNLKTPRNTNLPSNDFSCISVCGSYSREEEIKKLIIEQERDTENEYEQENDIEKGNQENRREDMQKEKGDHGKIVIKTKKTVKSGNPVKETNRKQTLKGTKRIETSVPSKKEEMEKKENKKEKKETAAASFKNKTKEMINNKYNDKTENEKQNKTTQQDSFCYTSNEASFRASLETVVSTFLETRDKTCNTGDFENVRTDKYELRAKKKITYVMPSIKRKLRRDSARQIFDPFLYNTMWKINK